MNHDHPSIVRLTAALRSGGADAPAAAIELLELLEPPTLEAALAHPCVTRADGVTGEAVRRAWRTYHHDRARSWN